MWNKNGLILCKLYPCNSIKKLLNLGYKHLIWQLRVQKQFMFLIWAFLYSSKVNWDRMNRSLLVCVFSKLHYLSRALKSVNYLQTNDERFLAFCKQYWILTHTFVLSSSTSSALVSLSWQVTICLCSVSSIDCSFYFRIRLVLLICTNWRLFLCTRNI